jgi:hypothetical protein
MFSYSVFIPRVFSNIKEERICNIFHNLNIGSVEHIDLVSKTSSNGDTYNMAFVHFAMVYNTIEAKKFREALDGGEKKTTIKYDGQWFWLVLPFEQKDKPVAENEKQDQEFRHQHHQPHHPHQPIIYPPSMEYMMANMVPVWLLTPNGPVLQWGCLHNTAMSSVTTQSTQSTKSTPIKKMKTTRMVPPQVTYGNLGNRQRQHPRKRLNVQPIEPRSTTYAKEHNQVNTNVNDIEDGEIDENDE